MEFSILTVASLHILEMLCFIKKFKGNVNIIFIFMAIIQRGKIDLHTQRCNKTLFQKRDVNVGVKGIQQVVCKKNNE
jgi:hypothetical protein